MRGVSRDMGSSCGDCRLPGGGLLIEPRIYRAAFVPALLAVVLAMFSFQSRPAALPQGLAADVLFDGDLAAQEAGRLAESTPDRRPGSAGDRATADRVAS